MTPDAAAAVAELSSVDAASFHGEVVPAAEPVVLRGLVRNWPVLAAEYSGDQAWADYLAAFSTGQPIETFHADAGTGGLFSFSDDLERFSFGRSQQTLAELLTLLLSPERPATSRYCYGGAINVPQHLPDFASAHANPLLGPEIEQLVSVWLGTETRIPAHWDLPQNLACVTRGRRRFTLFPISQVPNLYIGPLDITIAGQPSSLVDPYNPDLTRFPRFAEAARHARVAELGPGDALFIPSLWLHHVESLDPIGMLVNFWWRVGATGERFTPLHSLLHALLSLKDLPQTERLAWRRLFDHYIFRPDDADPAVHLPAAKRGVLGDLSPEQAKNLRQFLAHRLSQ